MARDSYLTRLAGVSRVPLVPMRGRAGVRVLEFLAVSNNDTVDITLTVVVERGGNDYPLVDALVLGTKQAWDWTGQLALRPEDQVAAYLSAVVTSAEPTGMGSWDDQ